MSAILTAALAIVLGVAGMMAFYWGTNRILDVVLADKVDADGKLIKSNVVLREAIRPWLFVGPALLLLAFFLVYPTVQTFLLTFDRENVRYEVTLLDASVLEDEAYAAAIAAGETAAGEETEDTTTELSAEELALLEEEGAEEEEPEVSEETMTFLALMRGLSREAGLRAGTVSIDASTSKDLTLILSAGTNLEDRVTETLDGFGLPITYERVDTVFDNYEWAINDRGFRISVRNNLLWLLVVPFASTAFGLLIAVLADRVRWEAIAKSLIFMPMAISFVGASIIWKFVYEFRPEGNDQIGLLNAIVVLFGGEPQAWEFGQPWNNFFLMIILIWIQTGFAMVLLSAALKGVPDETLEAARIDGANDIQVFFRIMIPQIMNTITVVMTTIVIVVLKVFDIVLTMTDGQAQTEVLANYMDRVMFRGDPDFGRGSVIAMTIMLAVIPFMIWNIVRFQREEQMR